MFDLELVVVAACYDDVVDLYVTVLVRRNRHWNELKGCKRKTARAEEIEIKLKIESRLPSIPSDTVAWPAEVAASSRSVGQ